MPDQPTPPERTGVRIGDLPNPPAPPKTWQDRYGPLIAAVAFAVLSALLRYAGIDAPPPQPPVVVMVGSSPAAATVSVPEAK